MYKNEIDIISEVSVKKLNFLNSGKKKYLISSAMAGMYVGFAIILIFVIAGDFYAVNSPATKMLTGLAFPVALSLVIMAGSELFTGNNMVMTIGALEKKVRWFDVSKIWLYCYIGNFIGAVVLSLIFVGSGLASGHTAEYFVKAAGAKMNAPFMQIFFRGILCNILVCLGTWCSYKLKSESGKLIMIFWCIFAFITSGFEHSIANMTTFSVALMIKHPENINLLGFVNNITASTLGNIVGGAVFMGLGYWYVSKPKSTHPRFRVVSSEAAASE